MARLKNYAILKYYSLYDTVKGTDKYVFHKLLKNGFHNPNYTFGKGEIMFVHLPKTGGTTITKILEKDTQHRFVHLNIHRPISILRNPHDYNYITVMRDPVERVWSQYQMLIRSEQDYPYRKYAIKSLEYLLENCWAVRNMNCRYLTGEIRQEPSIQTMHRAFSNLNQFYKVFDFSSFESEIKSFVNSHDIQMEEIPNERKASYHNPNSTEIELISRYNNHDITLYNLWLKSQNRSYHSE